MINKKKVKESRGSMAVYVSLVVLTMAAVLLVASLNSNSIRRNQIISVMGVKKSYESDNQNAGQIYRGLVKKLDSQYAFKEEFDSTITYTGSATTYSLNNGIITLNSSSNDPMMYMYNITSFSPIDYRYIDVRYKTSTSSSMEFFMIENPTNQTYSIQQNMTGDGQWHILTIDLWSNANVKNRTAITGWRWDWTGANGASVDVDYIRVRKA